MRKAEELAHAILAFPPCGPAKHREAAAHLRALDASHQRLKEALEAMCEYSAVLNPNQGWDDGSDPAEVKQARAAIAQAKDLP